MARKVPEDAMVSSNRTRAGRCSGLAVALVLLAGCGSERPGAPERQASAATAVIACSPVAAHPRHAGTACATCHLCRGAGEEEKGGVVFDPAGAAQVAGGVPAPVFDRTAKSCQNVACHGVADGTFSYYFPGGDGEPALTTVSYGNAPRETPSWLTSGIGCDGCHDNPPGRTTTTWHSGVHAGQGPTGAANQCQFCHPDATGANGVGTAITNPALHGNRAVEVSARFRSSCFSCH